ncbi:MAG: Threonine dehydrogenase and related Zn-dependent dehydrogenases [uncultured Thermoleophilia bacterium]|uniref:Threonine dehydrogenase and related Zn-dependent dehydrogenases n=1 Tax=uncultured Thermoleophilia bacterium TaxID=1497501 RepID=A0A6J4TAV1_9ACTN|nr:MAG: Threonine dehydrogenase and related Zn-dependent dehydrogenases [uncultured Thermoleophilia bacterium]
MPEIGPAEVLIRVANCGVCASEVDMWEGNAGIEFPRHVGHEVSGVIERVGADVTQFAPGDPVAAWVTGGGFAEYVAVEAEYCLPADGVPLDLALGEPLACAVNAVELTDVALGDDVVLIGAGFMGHLVHKLVELRGPGQVIVADARDDALARARAIGPCRTVNVREESLAEVVAELTGGRGADVTFEITGVQAPLTMAGEVTRMSGTVAIVGYHQGGTREIDLAAWNWNAFRVVNAHFRDVGVIMRGMRTGMRLLRAGRIDLSDVVTHRFGLDAVATAFETAHTKPEGFAKSTVSMEA